MTEFLSLTDLHALAQDCLTRAHASAGVASAVAAEIAAAEAAGERRHGMEALLRDLRLMRYGRLHMAATPALSTPRPGIIHVDALHGFAAAALAEATAELGRMAERQGIALLRLDRASDPGAMICATAALAQQGLAALAFGPAGPGRIAHPGLLAPALLRSPPRAALSLILPGIPLGQPADSPFGDAVAHAAWLVALDADLAGESFATAAIWDTATPPASAGLIACSAELLEQIVTA